MKGEKNMLYGRHPILEALKAGEDLDKLFLQRGLKGELISEIKALAKDHEVPIQEVPIEKLNKLTKGNHQGMVAFLSLIKYYKVEDILPKVYEEGQVPLFLILDEVTDIRNLGAMARTAFCAGVQTIIIPQKGAAPINADAIKSSAGALNKIPVCRQPDLKQVIQELQLNGIQIIAMDGRGNNLSYEIDLTIPTAIVMGSEDRGVANHLIKIVDNIVKLPVIGSFDSYNVSVAAGMVLYEAMRQRLQ